MNDENPQPYEVYAIKYASHDRTCNDNFVFKDQVTDTLGEKFLNPDSIRWEKHRVWVIESDLKEGTRHVYSKRTFYVDEDSWQILVADQYDGRGELWRVSEGHSINYYDEQTFWYTLELHIDLFSGRYNAGGIDNEMKMYDFDANLTEADFTPQSLRRDGKR